MFLAGFLIGAYKMSEPTIWHLIKRYIILLLLIWFFLKILWEAKACEEGKT